MLRSVAVGLLLYGLIGLVATSVLPAAGDRLRRVELPAVFETTTIALPDQGFLTATMPSQRVQRYDRDGNFLNGWFVDAAGGHFAVGLTRDGQVAICTARKRQLLVFDLGGKSLGARRPCFGAPREVPKIIQPDDFKSGEIELSKSAPARRPHRSWTTILLLPLWHPFIAWAMGLLGFLGLKAASRVR